MPLRFREMILSLFGVDHEKIHAIIMDKTHRFTGRTMPHSAMEKLALFLNRGQIDMDRYIDRKSKIARGKRIAQRRA
jgi:hypothetical protein